MIKAVADKIIVLLMRRTKSAGGIIIPNNIPDPQAYGRVMSVGEAIENLSIKVGDILVMHLNAGMDMVMEKKLMRTLKYEEVYGILQDKEFEKNLEEMIIGTEEGAHVNRAIPEIRPVS